jgi:Protein of unknown function (DUF3604)
MIVRFFGGWDFEPADANNRMPARVGYTKGVPMGGDLSAAPAGKSPTFLVAALKDPIGANLDRIQIIKGWLGKDGQTQERIYDTAVSGGRTIDADGRARQSVGNTVDVANATWTNTIGAGEMITVWKDPGRQNGARRQSAVIGCATPADWPRRPESAEAKTAKALGLTIPETLLATRRRGDPVMRHLAAQKAWTADGRYGSRASFRAAK